MASTDNLIDCFETYILRFDECIQSNVMEPRTLAGQRDALLPMLVSGDVKVAKSQGEAFI